MAQTKHTNRDGIFHLDTQGRLHYDAGARPAYIACGKARELARNTAYELGDLVIKVLADGATAIYHVYECTTAGTTHAATPAAGFATGAALRNPAEAELTDGTAGFTYAYTPDQAFYVNGVKTGRYITKRNDITFDCQFSNDKLHDADGFAYAEYSGSNGTDTFVKGSYFLDGLEVLSRTGASTYTTPAPSVALIGNADFLFAEGYEPVGTR
jgi:hypothetical protein